MLDQLLDTDDAMSIELIEAKIVTGFEDCRTIREIARDIATMFELPKAPNNDG